MRATFKVSRLGTIAGCMVTSGVVRRGSQVRVIRDGTVIYTTTISQLKRFKDDAREVAEGFECGILLENFNDEKEGDVLEAFETREIERTTLDELAPAAAAKSTIELARRGPFAAARNSSLGRGITAARNKFRSARRRQPSSGEIAGSVAVAPAFAPRASSSSTSARLPFAAAAWSGVLP